MTVDEAARQRVREQVAALVAQHGSHVTDNLDNLRAILLDLLPADREAIEQYPFAETLRRGFQAEVLPPAGGPWPTDAPPPALSAPEHEIGREGGFSTAGAPPPPAATGLETPPSASSSAARRWSIVALVTTVLLALVGVGIYAVTSGDGGSEKATLGASNTLSRSETSGPAIEPSNAGPPGSNKPPRHPSHLHVPRPFTSATLYSFAKLYFPKSQCRKPTRTEAPVAFQSPDKERVKCGDASTLFSGTYWCKANIVGLTNDRNQFLADSQGARRLLRGRPAPLAGIRIDHAQAYHHVQSNDPRVYWQSTDQRCAAEIQGNVGATMSETIRFWRYGR
ncbi:MAG: hypothetical protein ACR2LE_09785 [Nocardioidaceae bacterium]